MSLTILAIKLCLKSLIGYDIHNIAVENVSITIVNLESC